MYKNIFSIVISLLLHGCGGSGSSDPVEPVIEPIVNIEIDADMQSFAFDGSDIYVLDRSNTVSRYDNNGRFMDQSPYLVGHQGLSFDGSLWSTDYYDKKSAVQFNYNGDVRAIYRLFGDDFSDLSSCTPTVSKDYLAAIGYREGHPIVRVWYKDSPNPDNYLYEWDTVDTKPIQGIVIDGQTLWISTGIHKHKWLYHITLEGELLSKEPITYAGEPEGLDIVGGKLKVGMVEDGKAVIY